MSPPVAMVTGANRSLGLQVAKDLYAKGFTVVLACRDVSKGNAVLDEIAKAYEGPAIGHKLSVIRLDLSDASSIPTAVEEFKKHSDRLDVLVNNAAILSKDRREALKVNFFNTIAVTEAFLPLLAVPKTDRKIKSRVVIVGSRMGCLENGITGDALATLTEAKDLKKILAIAKAWEDGDDSTGLAVSIQEAPYCNSKALIHAYGRILAQRVADEKLPVNVYMTCPGYCATDINGHSGHRTIQEGADTISWAASDESIENASGKFFADREEIPYDHFDLVGLMTPKSAVAAPAQ